MSLLYLILPLLISGYKIPIHRKVLHNTALESDSLTLSTYHSVTLNSFFVY